MNNKPGPYVIKLILLTCLGLLGNHFSLPLFFGVDFIFGSIATLIAVRLLGTAGAVTVAAISGSYTYLLWGHPYALIIFSAEALIVSVLIKRKITSITLADLIFWVTAGMPLVWFFYNGIMNMSETQALLILFKQPINGIANALIATYLLLLIPCRYTVENEEEPDGRLELREILFTTLLAFSFSATVLLMIYQNITSRESYEKSLETELLQSAEHLKYRIYERGELKDSALKDDNNKSWIKNRDVIIIDENNNIISSTLGIERASEFLNHGVHKRLNSDISLWMPERNNMPFMLWWKQAYYYISYPVIYDSKTNILVLQKSEPIIAKLQNDILTAFIILFILTIFGGVISYAISDTLTRTLIQIINITKDLPNKLHSKTFIHWPDSSIAEISQLSKHTKIMSDNLSDAFSDVTIHAKAIIESSIDAIITIDEKGIVDSFNKSAEKLFGYQRSEVIGENVKILMPEPYKSQHDDYIKNYQQGKRTPLTNTRREVVGLKKDNTTFPMELTVTKIKLRNKEIYTGIVTDISERKATEKVKQEFISTVSHELRTPLTAIKGSINLIQGRKGLASDEETDTMLSVTARNVERLTELINDLLDFEKLDSGGIKYQLEQTDINSLITGIIDDDQPFAEQANINLLADVSVNGSIHVDRNRMCQVLNNFISNALKFSPPESNVIVGSIEQGNDIKIYVKDSGQGISDEFKTSIFQRFSQEDSSDTRKIQRGTGLGLAISKRITEDMGGTIGFDSIAGQGSTFYVIFPYLKQS